MAASPEQKKQYHVSKSFKGLNTKANRTAIGEDEFSWIENVQPIGFGNLKVVPNYSNVSATWSNTVTEFISVNINNADYLLAFQADGSAQYYNIATSTQGNLAVAGTFTGTGVRAKQWKNERAIILDPAKGYYTWDAIDLIPVGSLGAVGITFPGSHYVSPPIVTISAPNVTNGVQATAVCSISNAAGTVTSILVNTIGSAYTSVPTVTVSPPSSSFGVQAQASASIQGGNVVVISVNNPGSGYTSAPSVSITGGGGANATATAVLGSGLVSAIAITEAGSGYTAAPTITISGGQTANVAVANVARTSNVATITTSSAHGISTGDVVDVSTSNATFNGTRITVASIPSNVTFTYANTGSNLAIAAATGNVSFSAATAVAGYLTFKTGAVGILITAGGTGYTSAPNVTITGAGTTANAVAIVNGGVVTQVVVTNPGNNYTSNTTVSFSGGNGSGATAKAITTVDSNVDIASFQGRVWIAQGRTVFYSAAGSYNDYITVSAGNINLQDDTLHSKINALVSANNFLYVFGENSINVFSDVRVGTAGNTLFTNTNVSASIGSRRIDAIFPYFRSLLFATDYGIYALVGATTSKLSDALDGIFPNINFNYPITGGQVLLNNILCAAFNFYYNDPLTATTRPIQAVFFDKKWFITSQGTTARVTSIAQAGGVYLYSTNGTNLQKLYNDSTAAISSELQSALWPMNDTIRDKQALKWGLEAILGATGGTVTVTVDNETGLGTAGTYTATNLIDWKNITNSVIGWKNNSNAAIGWTGGAAGYYLYKYDAQQYGKYLGLTLQSNSPALVYSTLEMEYELRARF
jgi:hypothetical protein